MTGVATGLQHLLVSSYGLPPQRVASEPWASLAHGSERYADIEAILPDDSSGWPISKDLARFLARFVIRHRPRHILEFGAGSSSLVLARALAHIGGGQLTSIEQSPEWCAEQWQRVTAIPNIDAQIVKAKLQLTVSRGGMYFAYRDLTQALAARGPFDLVLIDAPQWFYGRDGALHSIYEHLSPNAAIVLDDAQRGGEQLTLCHWLCTYPGLQLAFFEPRSFGRGLAVLRHNGNKQRQFALRPFISSVAYTLRFIRERHRFARGQQPEA